MRLSEKCSLEIVGLNLLRVFSNLIGFMKFLLLTVRIIAQCSSALRLLLREDRQAECFQWIFRAGSGWSQKTHFLTMSTLILRSICTQKSGSPCSKSGSSAGMFPRSHSSSESPHSHRVKNQAARSWKRRESCFFILFISTSV